jgi:WD40 repeat protein
MRGSNYLQPLLVRIMILSLAVSALANTSCARRDVQLTPRLHDGAITAVSICRTGLHAVSAGSDGSLVWWDLSTRKGRWVFGAADSQITYLDIAPDDNLFAASMSSGDVLLFDTRTNESRTIRIHNGHIYKVLFSDDGQLLASCASDEVVHILDVSTGSTISTLALPRTGARSFAWADSRRIIIGGDDGQLYEWNIVQHEAIPKITYGSSITAIDISKDCNRVVLGFASGEVVTLQFKNFTPLWKFQAFPKRVRDVICLEGYIATIGDDISIGGEAERQISLLDAQDGTKTLAMDGYMNSVTGIDAASNHLIGSSRDGTIRIWNYRTGKRIGILIGSRQNESRFGTD